MQKSSLLTKRQQEVLQYLSKYYADEGYPPTIKEIADNFKMKSQNQAKEILEALEKKGKIQRKEKGTSRAYKIISETKPVIEIELVKDSKSKSLVIIGEGNADNYFSVFANSQDKLEVDSKLFSENNLFVSPVDDSGLSKMGILEGDLAIVNQTFTPKHEALVLIINKTEKIVRIFYETDNGIELRATDKYFPKLYPNDTDTNISILGVVIGIIRKL